MNKYMQYRIQLARWIGRQTWLRRGRDRLVRMLASPEKIQSLSVATPFETDFFGYVYPGDLSNFIDWSVYIYGSYATNELLLLRDIAQILRKLKKNVVFFDIGANVGQHSLFMAQHSDAVFSFEPYAVVREKLEEKKIKNFLQTVKIFPVGLGDCNADLYYTVPSRTNLGTGSFQKNASGREKILLTVKRGDDYFAQQNFPPMDLVKIDVEGFESDVLTGLKHCLAQDRPILLMELSGKDRSGFLSKDRLSSLLYPDHVIYSVQSRHINGTYRLLPFHFDTAEEIIVFPLEFNSAIKDLLL